MPNPLNNDDNFETIENWLEENLTNENSFTPNQDAIPELFSKGIYFWFMKREGYQILSEYKEIEALEEKYSRIIDGEQFDLVYIDESYKNEKTINETLNWHIDNVNDTEGINALKKSSPLRKVIGALLSDDLIDGDIQINVSNFIRINLKVFWVNDFTCDFAKIYSTVKTLNLVLKPLFVKPNETSIKTLNDIKDRRDKVYYNTTKKHFGITYDYLNYINKGLTPKAQSENIAEWIVDNRRNCNNISYKEISLKNTEINKCMGEKLNEKLNIINKGVIVFKLFKENPETKEEDNKDAIWQSQDLSGWRYTRSRKQDLDKYFNNTESGNRPTKYKSIIEIMGTLHNIYFKFYYLND